MTRQLGIPLFKFNIRYEQDIVTARHKTRELCRVLGFDLQDQARVATGVSELTRNVYQYAFSGTIEYYFRIEAPQQLMIKVSDKGPGIRDLPDILNGVYQSKTGMGVGLLGTKKLSDSFEINSNSNGTTISFGKILSRRSKVLTLADIHKAIESLTSLQPGSAFEEVQNQNRELLKALEEVNIAREQLAQLNNELAETNRGVVALYAELDEKADSLQKSNEVKTSFLSNMTHEFRTPLSSIISLTRILLSHVDGELNSEQEKQVRYIQKSSEGLLDLVNDLLDLAKVEAGKVSVNVSDFHIDEILGSLRGMFRPILGHQSEVVLEVLQIGSAFELQTDQGKISQILRNFVSNAVKFTDKGSITVTAELVAGDMVEFRVKDTGIGIERKNIDYIFEDFSQVDSYLQKKQKGTGLGLPLAKKLASLLHGEITVESVIGEGSTFSLIVPRVYGGDPEGILFPRTEGAAITEPISDDSSEKFKILIVDDDEPSRYILKNLISRELDAIYKEAANGKEGLDLVQSWKPDAIFLDLAMPILSGYEVLNRLITAGNTTPVIINTSSRLSSDEIEFLKTKATAVLSKDRSHEKAAEAELRLALGEAGFDYKGGSNGSA